MEIIKTWIKIEIKENNNEIWEEDDEREDKDHWVETDERDSQKIKEE